MTGERAHWELIGRYANGLEAEIAAARIREAGLDAVVRGDDLSGIFGAGFQGTAPRGWEVLVPNTVIDLARMALTDSDDGPDDDEDA